MLARVRFMLRAIFRRSAMERELATELQLHHEREVAKLVARGVPMPEANRLARLAMGGLDQVKERTRDMWGTQWIESTVQDARYALRTLRRAPGYTLVALMTLGLGIGANSAIFSVVHGVLLSPLPFTDPDRLYRVTTLYPDGTPYSLSAPDFMSVREQTRIFEQVEALSSQTLTLLGSGDPIEVRATRVSDRLFDLLGLRVVLGRALRPEETQPGRGDVVVLDHGFWQRQFGGDHGVIGRSIRLADTSMEVVGVLAPEARTLQPSDVYAPLTYDGRFSASTADERRGEFLAVIGRARPGLTGDQANADLRRIGTELQAAFRETNEGLTFSAIPLRTVLLGDVRAPLLVLLGAVGFVLLVACTNVANLLLARASSRQLEMSVRAALGAGRGRLFRQLLTEAVVLGAAGAAIGLALAYVATRALVATQLADLPRIETVGVNGPVVLFTLVVALATSLLFGTLPALRSSGASVHSGLEGARGSTGSRGHVTRDVLVVVEVALAVVLLVGAGLLIRSVAHLAQAELGFQPDHLTSFRVTLRGEGYRDDAVIRARVGEMLERTGALPGVASIAATSVLPLDGRGAMVGFAVEGAPPPPPNVNPEIAIVVVTPDYFRTVGTPLRRGRALSDSDHAESPLVAIANEAAVRRWFPGQDPLGRRVLTNGVPREIVGTVADTTQQSAADPVMPTLFVPLAQRPTRSVRVVVRTTGEPDQVAAAIPSLIRALDPDLAVADVGLATSLVGRSLARPRLYTGLLTMFAGVALTMAATGIFAVMNYAVAQRTREIGVRMALGARRAEVMGAIVRRAVALALVGSAAGLVAAALLSRALQGQLYGVARLDPLAFGAALIVLVGSAGLAAFLPARRAARIDPATVLRDG